MVLAATLRGLGTCWVGGSWDRSEAARHCRLSAGEELYLGVVIGYPERHLDRMAKSYAELVAIRDAHRESKTYEQFTAPMSDEARRSARLVQGRRAGRDEGAERDEPPADRLLIQPRR